MLDLTSFLSSGSHPHTAEIAVGGGNKLAVTFRASDPARAQSAILEAVGEDLAALGLDPLITLKACAGQMPKGDAAQQAFKDALDALDADAETTLNALMQKAEGASIADIVGSFEAIIGGKREAFADSVTPESCAALPADVKRTILHLASSVALPVGKLDFLGEVAGLLAGGKARFETERSALGSSPSAERRAGWHEERERAMEAAYRDALALLDKPENHWAGEAIRFYLDVKDHGRGLSPESLTPWGRACFSAIRQGSGGLLGNPPLL